ncbi:MAG: hypothetical protein NVSMB1_16020 [Polyangiales bacterium]
MVYEATHACTGQRAAIRVMRPECASDPAQRDHFLHDGHLPNRIQHEARVEVLGIDRTDEGVPFFVLELLEGETLEDIWEREAHSLPVLPIACIAERIADYLDACHAIGLVHRSLDLASVFITRRGTVKILDSGVVRLRPSCSKMTAMRDSMAKLSQRRSDCGAPSFPPLADSQSIDQTLDERSDLRNLGALIFRLIFGSAMPSGPVAPILHLLTRTIPSPPNTLVELIGSVLRGDFVSAEEARDVLFPILTHLGAPEPEHFELVIAKLLPNAPSFGAGLGNIPTESAFSARRDRVVKTLPRVSKTLRPPMVR